MMGMQDVKLQNFADWNRMECESRSQTKFRLDICFTSSIKKDCKTAVIVVAHGLQRSQQELRTSLGHLGADLMPKTEIGWTQLLHLGLHFGLSVVFIRCFPEAKAAPSDMSQSVLI